ncbi:putative gtp-binding protein obg [Phaeomoniella chlamydospora]|uniref:Putative gtp-binding protein obg n=1 Tax=Phaeomoniella chlamydospora TaxID=158046 RepID=A0A0G2GGX5_PHACM|nr:putative gtp-binding protein obg [Phaeomoniella chlamydospora]
MVLQMAETAGTFRAGRGRGGMGKNQGGRRGEDVVIEVPIGTVVKEVERWDFASDEEREANSRPENLGDQARKLVFYPGGGRDEQRRMQRQMERDGLQMPDFGIRRNPMKSMEPALPIRLDLDAHMSQPMLLAAGGIGGLGNPHFSTAEVTRPKIASRGQMGVKVRLELELKLLADVGLVGLPNAGKSTLLRSITNSRTRVGNWAFTTLEPKIGTVILDDHKGRPRVRSLLPTGETRTNFTIADIPGLVEGAHLDRGLGLGFLRHIERARILCFVIDLSAGDAVLALQNLWNELGQYEALRNEQLNLDTEKRFSEHDSLDNPFASIGGTIISPPSSSLRPSEAPSPPATTLPPLRHSPISSKPWFIVATKADLPSTQSNFLSLKTSLQKIQAGEEPHPSGKPNTWSPQQNGDPVECLPVSAMKGEGVENVVGIVTGILDRL